VGHCQSTLGNDLASADVERVLLGQCCCHSLLSCQCLAPKQAAEGALEVVMVGALSLPEEKCPSSLVEGLSYVIFTSRATHTPCCPRRTPSHYA
jgi:hypothetical protein